jgi:hypothetical protein
VVVSKGYRLDALVCQQAGLSRMMTASFQPSSRTSVAGYPTDKPPGHVRGEARLLACIMHHQVASNSTTLTAGELRKEEKEAKSICHRSRWTAVVTVDSLGTFGPCFLPGRVVGVSLLVSYSRSGWSVPSCLFLWTRHRDEERR